MQVQILVDDHVITTQIVSLERYPTRPSCSEIKRTALRAALEDHAIRVSEGLRATFRLFDVAETPTGEIASSWQVVGPDAASSRGDQTTSRLRR